MGIGETPTGGVVLVYNNKKFEYSECFELYENSKLSENSNN